MSETLSLSWDTHQSNICNGLSQLQQSGEFVDMTLAADGHHVKVHKMVMSLVSPYIKDLISSAQCPHPVVFLNNISHSTLCSLLEYIYTGEVNVNKEKLQDLLAAGRALHIKGLQDTNMPFKIVLRSGVSMTAQIDHEPPETTTGSPSPPVNNIEEMVHLVQNENSEDPHFEDDTEMRTEETLNLKPNLDSNPMIAEDAQPEEKKDNEQFYLEQINNKRQFDILENVLMDKAERTKLHKKLSFLFQTTAGNGVSMSYTLIDLLISRKFLCSCSWSGASRGNSSKIPFKDYKFFIRFFCDMIRSWDPTFTMEQMENFFKTCLRNSVKRMSMKNLRSSSKRSRKSKLKAKV